MAESNHKVEIVSIGKIEKHPNADSLGIVHIWDWQCIVRLADWEDEDFAAYIVPDSLVDTKRPEFAFLAGDAKSDGWARIKVKKLRGLYSQGLLLPVHSIPDDGYSEMTPGLDVADMLGVKRYEPPVWDKPMDPELLAQLRKAKQEGRVRDFPQYDLESWPRYGKLLLTEGEEVVITEKIHGANARFMYDGEDFWVGSRTLWKRETPNDKWWQAFRRYPQIAEFLKEFPKYVLFGEIFGAVQDMKYGRNFVDFAAFDFMRYNNTFLNIQEMRSLLDRYQIPQVPRIYRGPYNPEQAKMLAEGPTLAWLDDGEPGGVNQVATKRHCREGIVITPVVERSDPHKGRVKLKLVGNGYYERKEAKEPVSG